MPGVRLRWEPKEGLNTMLTKVKNRRPLNRKLCAIMIAMANTAHGKGGDPRWPVSNRARQEGGRTGYMTGRLQRGWRPVAGKPRIENRTAYAVDFYHGHPARTVNVPAHARKTKKGFVGVKAHTRRERAQPGRPIRWTKRYIGYAETEILKHVLK